jgi:Protein of unknown function (DUF2934)
MTTQIKKTKAQKSTNEADKPLLDANLRHQTENRAYEIWLSSGCSHGDDVAHWLQAENEVLVAAQKNPSQTP